MDMSVTATAPNLVLDRFDAITDCMLPMARLEAERDTIAARYRAAMPYPHVVLDGFFDAAVLERVEREFPAPGRRDWLGYDTVNEIKQTSRGILDLPPFTQIFLWQMCSAPFMDWLRAVTGIADLCVDPTFHGGGLHESRRGGWLNLHADWTQHPHLPLVRQLNMIIYLNRDWQEEWGGALELHGPGGGPIARVAPVFNRAVIFPTTSETVHGFPQPMTCPADRARRSVSWFYWSPDRAAIQQGAPISFLPGTRTTRARALLRSCVPPLAFQLRDRLRGALSKR
jgi:hypothetical protein